MSATINKRLRQFEDVSTQLRCIVEETHAKELSKSDRELYASCLSVWFRVLYDILAGVSPDRTSRIIRFAYAMARTSPRDLALALKQVQSFTRNYVVGWRITYSDFKRQHCAEFPFLGDLLSPIKEEFEEFLSSGSALSFAIVNQHICLYGRTEFASYDYSEEMISEYYLNEQRLASLRLPSYLVSELNLILKEWLQDFSWENFVPNHGPGATEDKDVRCLHEKYLDLGIDASLRYFLQGIDDDWLDFYPATIRPEFRRSCEVIFVPKSALTWRVISKEPTTLMYFQQGIWNCIEHHLKRHRYLSQHIRISDQPFNRARAGQWVDGCAAYATVDLSAASDSVSWELIKGIFRGTPLLRACFATRSRTADLPDGNCIALHKFAPMGSALCFPIECLVFGAICENVARKRGGRSDWSVYGDDIIVPACDVVDLFHDLEALGFKVNSQKSFLSANLPFRESCGGEFYSGYDVTPVRLPRKFQVLDYCKFETITPDVFTEYVDLANTLYLRGWRLSRLWFVHRLLSLPQHLKPPFVTEGFGILSTQPTNFHLIKRWSKDWQRYVARHGSLVTRYECEPEPHWGETIRYFEWLRQNRRRERPLDEPAHDKNTSRSVCVLSTSKRTQPTLLQKSL